MFGNFNGFTGELPAEVGNLSYLEDLFLYENDLQGQIPTTLGQLTRLKTLSLAQNAFGGSIPTELGSCTDLEILALHRAAGSEKGPGITGPLPAFSNLKNIAEIYLENQKLYGSIHADFLSNAPVAEVIKVDLSFNGLTGTRT